MWYIYTIELLLFSRKKWCMDTCYSTDESWKRYATSKRPVTRELYCVIPFKWKVQKGKSIQKVASLVAQTVKNLRAMWETWVRSLGGEDPLEEGMATHCSTVAWRIPVDKGTWRATVHGVAKGGHGRETRHSTQHIQSRFTTTGGWGAEGFGVTAQGCGVWGRVMTIF